MHRTASLAGAPPRLRRRRIVAKLDRFLAQAMPLRIASLILALLFAANATVASAQAWPPKAQQVISRAFAASGGQGWYLLRGWRETGRRGGAPYESWLDPVRYGLRNETREAAGLRLWGFNGQAVWQVAPDGAITAVNDHPSLAAARTEAYFAGGLYLFPGRFGAKGDYLGVRRLDGRAYDVLRVTPWNGQPRELWFDQRNRLLARIVDRSGAKPSAVRVADYRRVGPVLVPFALIAEPGSGPSPLARQRESVVFAPADRDLFSLDRPQALAKVRQAQASALQAPGLAPHPVD